ncbi:MAG: flippase [Thermodesulfobacteriota bacterium]
MALGKSQKVIKNTIFNNIGYLLHLLIGLFLTPFIIHKLGVEQFGIWVLLEVIVIYLGLLDFTGIGGAFVKYIAEYHTKKDFENCNHVINLGWAYYTFFWIVIFLFVITFKKPLLNLFSFSPDLYGTASFVFIGILLISFIRGSFAVFSSVLLGLQRMDITNIITVVTSIVNAVFVVLFLSSGYGLKGLVMSGLIVAILSSLLQVIFAYKVLPQIRFRPFSFNKAIFLKTFSYGSKIRIASMAELINAHADKVFLGYFLNTGLVGFYELGAKIANIARSLPMQLLPAILPASSELHALNDKENLQKLYHRGSKYLGLLTFPIAFFTVSNASWIMTLWLGETGFKESVLALQILSIGYVFMLLVSMGRLIARGMGIPQYEMRSSILIVIMNTVLSIILIMRFGFIGALLGTTISGIVGSIYFIYSFHCHIKQPLLDALKKLYVNPLIFCIISFFASMLISRVLIHEYPVNRIEAFYSLLISGSLFLGVYLLTLFKSRYIDEYDREIFSGLVELIAGCLRRQK